MVVSASVVKSMSAPPRSTRSPLSVSPWTCPLLRSSVRPRNTGPSTSRLTRVVISFMVEAGCAGRSARCDSTVWLSRRTTTLSASSGIVVLRRALSTGAGNWAWAGNQAASRAGKARVRSLLRNMLILIYPKNT